MRLAAFWLATALLVAGCFRSDQDRALPSEIGKSGFDLVSYTGATRGAYIWPETNTKRVCAEPPPDLALTTAREISANLKAAAQTLGNISSPSIDAGGAAKLSSAAIELAGRSQVVLLAREFLYRQCELAANFSHDAVRYKELSEQQKLVLEAIGKLADADRTRAAAALLEVQTEAARLNLVQDADIAKVLAFVTAADGSLDRDAVKRLLDAAKLDPSFRSSIETRTTLADLQDYLQAVPDSVSRALAGAVPQKE